MTIQETQDSIIADFKLIGDEFNRYTLLIELSKELPKPGPEHLRDELLVEGCQSRVWLDIDYPDGLSRIIAYSDTLIIRGILTLVLEVYNGHTKEEIRESELYFFEGAGIAEFLSEERTKGMAQVIRTIRASAEADR